MKKAVSATSKYTGEERLSGASSMVKRLFEKAQKPTVIDKVIDKEAIKSVKDVVANEAKQEINTVVSQVFGIELTPGRSVDLSQKAEEYSQKEESREPRITSEHMSYFSEFKREINGASNDETSNVIKSQLDSILHELKSLKSSSDELENVFKDVAIDTPPEKPGIYHLTFFEGFLKLVIKMKNKVEDGVTYAKLFKSRKKERSYHSQAQKKGTSFTLHHDRSVATQTG